MKKTKDPVVLTVNGKAAMVVQDAEVVEILRQRLALRGRKKGRSAEEFFNEFFIRNNIPGEDHTSLANFRE